MGPPKTFDVGCPYNHDVTSLRGRHNVRLITVRPVRKDTAAAIKQKLKDEAANISSQFNNEVIATYHDFMQDVNEEPSDNAFIYSLHSENHEILDQAYKKFK